MMQHVNMMQPASVIDLTPGIRIFSSFRPKSEHNSATRKTLSSGTASSLWRITLRQIYRSSNLVPILNPFMICSWDTGKSPRRIRNLVPVILRHVGQTTLDVSIAASTGCAPSDRSHCP